MFPKCLIYISRLTEYERKGLKYWLQEAYKVGRVCRGDDDVDVRGLDQALKEL